MRIPTIPALIVFCLFQIQGHSQTALIDSLQKRAGNVVGTERTKTLLQLSEAWLDVDPQKSIELSDECYSTAVRSGSKTEKGLTLMVKAKAYYRLNQFPESKAQSQKALEYFSSINDRQNQSLAYTMLGHIAWKSREYQSAIDYYNQAIILQKKAEFIDLQAQSYQNIGIVFRDMGQYESALQNFLKALEMAQKLERKELIASSYHLIAGIYWKTGDYNAALEHYQASLKIREQMADKSEIAASLANIGIVYKDMGQFEKALEYQLKALEINKQLGNRSDEAYSLNSIGSVYWRLGKFDEALNYYQQSLSIRTTLADSANMAAVFDNLGHVYRSSNRLKEALANYSQSLEIREKLGKPIDVAESYNNMGSIYLKLAKYDLALDYYLKSLEIRQKQNDQIQIAVSLNNVGLIYQELENYTLAIDYHNRALEMSRTADNKMQMAAALTNCGNAWYKSNNLNQALDHYMQSLRIRQGAGDKVSTAASLVNIGLVYRDMADWQKATDFFTDALNTYLEIGNQQGIATVYNHLGDVYSRQNLNAQAIEQYQKAYDICPLSGNQRGMAITCLNMGQYYLKLKEYGKALPYLEKSVALAHQIGDGELIRESNFESYQLYQAMGNKAKALDKFVEYSHQKDSMLNADNAKRIADLQIRFETSIRQSKIEQLQMLQAQTSEALKNRTWFLALLSVVLLVTLFLVLKLYLVTRKLKKANKMLEKAFSIIAHDFRSPVSTMYSIIGLLNNPQYKLTTKERSTLTSHADGMAKSMMALLDNLLNWSRNKNGIIEYRPERINLHDELIRNFEMLDIVAKNKEIELQNNLVPNHWVFADKNALALVYRNLITNAIKYSNAGGKVRVFSYENDRQIIVGVEDNGIGIPANKIELVTSGQNNASEQGTKLEIGTGLGLKLCYEFISINKGKFWAESIENTQTIFYFSLPKLN